MITFAKNIIIQNIFITNLNEELLWGGDAISIFASDMIWIDHVTFKLIGRQFIDTGYPAAGRITISNSQFDGRTPYSATCNGMHYWAIVLYGKGDFVTFFGNYIHNTSGRGPKMGGTSGEGAQVHLHAANNLWEVSLAPRFCFAPVLTLNLACARVGPRNRLRRIGMGREEYVHRCRYLELP